MNIETLTLAAPDGTFEAYLVLPDTIPSAGVVVIQEIFGVNQFVRQVTESLAQAGFVAIAPDLFWRQHPGIQLNDQDPHDREIAFRLYGEYQVDRGVEDLKLALSALRTHPACTGKVGSVGFCLGGKLAYLLATRSDADCNVSYYGVDLENQLAESAQIQAPLLLHIAEQDMFVPPEAQAQIQAGLQSNPQATIYSYPEVNHGFARLGGSSYNADAAGLANDRTMNFLKQYLLEDV
jgi:carboxymethylenebutenolidase